MKKLSVILALALIVLSLLPTVCLASTAPAAVGVEDVYLINPISVALQNNTLFVADKVSNEQCLLHAFDLTDKPVLIYTEEIAGNVNKIKVDGDNLFVVMTDKFAQYTIESDKITLVQAYNVKDVADVNKRDDKLVVLLTNGKRTNANGDNLGGQFVDGDGIASLCLDDTYYWMYNNSGTSYYVTGSWKDQEFVLANPTALEQKLDGMTVANGQVLFFNQTSVVDATKHLYLDTDVENTFVDVAGNGTTTLVAVVNKSANVYSYKNDRFEQTYTIGSDTVAIATPSLDAVTRYTLVKPVGYPANIVYKTTDASTSVESIIDDAAQLTFVILDYATSSSDEYYYVFVGDRFGWVKKSATSIEEDAKLEVIDTSVSNDVATYQGKLMSANATYVYKLPSTTANMQSFYHTTLSQTATNPTTVAVLQSFVASDNTAWYYVKYPTTNGVDYGFVLQGNVGSLSVKQVANATVTLEKQNPHMKVNASLTDGVSIYATKDMLETALLTDADGNPIKLETNTKVGVITRLDEVSYVQVVYPNGTTYYGWVENHHLITLNAMTTNTVVGISFISVAILLIVTTTAIVRKRQLRKQNPVIVDEE